ncbi:MAG: hypothetical protein HC899_14565 [Leptolyngbyaceae cyanobacterium SM1_4_3]|nr:hypothetical protein [Leptolyngbyaceae cyanobacterium SM1_4_3]NJN89221.1 hypothetical protein [Leptolyngbyaceae cyanobacterium SL_5_14]
MVSTYTKPFFIWRIASIFLVLMMAVCIAISSYWIFHDKSLASDYLGSIDSLIAICSALFVPLINGCISQEVKSQRANERNNQVQESNEITDALFQGLETILNQRLVLIQNQLPKPKFGSDLSPDQLILNDIDNLLSYTIDSLRMRYSAIQQVRNWLGNKDFLQKLSRDSGDFVLSQNSSNTSTFSNFLSMFNISVNPQQKQLYQEIYDCLMWIRKSFYIGDYIPTKKLLGERLKHPGMTLDALKWIQSEFLMKNLADEPFNEISIYFGELIQQIENKLRVKS